MNLYHVQDGERPMYVIAANCGEALERWQEQIRSENEGDEGEDPQGVALIATGSDLEAFPELLLPAAARSEADEAK